MKEQVCPKCNEMIHPEDIEDFINHVKRCKSTHPVRIESDKKSKMGNVRSEYKGDKFDSMLEAKYCEYLDQLIFSGSIKYYLRQTTFHLSGGTKYRVDFTVIHSDDRVEFIDVKGFETKDFKRNKKQVEALYPVDIIIVKKGDF